MSDVRQLLSVDSGKWSLKIVDWMKLNINVVGYRLNGLDIKVQRETEGPGFEFYVQGRG